MLATPPRLITLMTDFGLKDGNVGVMKGVILSLAPHVQIVDLSHLISPQNIPEAALILSRSVPFFPSETIHVVVVDPGVGTQRRPMAARLGSQFYVGPDNGTITLWFKQAERENLPLQFVALDRPQYWLEPVSPVFNGRDIFAPVAGHLASGVPLEALGATFTDPVQLRLPQPVQTPTGWAGEVIHIDHFGNIATNLRREHLGFAEKITVLFKGQSIPGLARTFGEHPPGELVALYGSTGSLLICEVNGSAVACLQAEIGDKVWVNL